jgi:hypothetical protein
VTIYYREPSYARSRGIPVHEQRGTFEVTAHGEDEAKRLAVEEFKEAARRSSVNWVREITRVTFEKPSEPVVDESLAKGVVVPK